MADKTTENKGIRVEGFLTSNGNMLLVQKECVEIKNQVNADGTQACYYNLTFSNGTKILMCTAGAKVQDMELFKSYILGFDFVDKKLKLADYHLIS